MAFRWAKFRRWVRSEKSKALLISLGIHAVLLVGLFAIVLPAPRPGEPVLVVRQAAKEDNIQERKFSPHQMKKQARPPAPSRTMREVVSKMPSPVFARPVEFDETALEFPGMSVGSARPGVGMHFGGKGFQSSNIGRIFVRAQKLGVILDNSGSMSEYLEDLRKEIRRGFRGAIFMEIWGCRLEAISEQQGIMIPGLIYHDPAAVMKGVRKLVEDDRVDAIYWFTDLRDGETNEALEELEHYLGVGAHRAGQRPVKFYVRSLAENPSRELAQIIERSGGEIEVGPM